MSHFKFMMITASPEIGKFIEANGVDRIFMDQEVLGKADRQGHLDTHKAAHSLEQIEKMAKSLGSAELMVRLNPLTSDTKIEIDQAIDHGAQRLMLPMFRTRDEVDQFLTLVDGRVPISLLVETPQALARMPDWLSLIDPKRDDVHIGLNDLSIGMGLNFLFEPLAHRLLDSSAELLNRIGVHWGFGGIARAGRGALSAEKILGEHVRLGSQRVILSRAFHEGAESAKALLERLDFSREIQTLEKILDGWRNADSEALWANQLELGHKTLELGRGKDQ